MDSRGLDYSSDAHYSTQLGTNWKDLTVPSGREPRKMSLFFLVVGNRGIDSFGNQKGLCSHSFLLTSRKCDRSCNACKLKRPKVRTKNAAQPQHPSQSPLSPWHTGLPQDQGCLFKSGIPIVMILVLRDLCWGPPIYEPTMYQPRNFTPTRALWLCSTL